MIEIKEKKEDEMTLAESYYKKLLMMIKNIF